MSMSQIMESGLSTTGPVADRLTIWPMDDGSYGLDATFQGASGYDRAEWHIETLKAKNVRHSLRQELFEVARSMRQPDQLGSPPR